MVSELNGVDPDKLYDISQTCVLLDINRNTLRRYTKQNKIKMVVRKADGKIFYRGSEMSRLVLTTI